jgi:SNF2 family DNA or RNA helicase
MSRLRSNRIKPSGATYILTVPSAEFSNKGDDDWETVGAPATTKSPDGKNHTSQEKKYDMSFLEDSDSEDTLGLVQDSQRSPHPGIGLTKRFKRFEQPKKNRNNSAEKVQKSSKADARQTGEIGNIPNIRRKSHMSAEPTAKVSREVVDIVSPGVREVRKVRTILESPITPPESLSSNLCLSHTPDETSLQMLSTPVPSTTLLKDPATWKQHRKLGSASDSDCDIIDLTVAAAITNTKIGKDTMDEATLLRQTNAKDRVKIIKIEAPRNSSPAPNSTFGSPRRTLSDSKSNPSISQKSGADPHDDDEEDQWFQRLQTWSNDMALASRLEEDYAQKVIEMIPLEETLEDELETIRQGLVAENGGIGTPRGLSIQLLDHQIIGLCWMMRMEKNENFKGGILADEMGVMEYDIDGQDDTDAGITSSESLVSEQPTSWNFNRRAISTNSSMEKRD